MTKPNYKPPNMQWNGYSTKGEWVYHMKHDLGWTWPKIASVIPGGTISNCSSAYYQHLNKISKF